MSETWTEKTRQSETWTASTLNVVGDGFSQGFAARPAFQIAYRNGIWTQRTEQSETWTVVT